MATYSQLPGSMNLAFRRGNDFATLITFDGVELVGYAVSATLTSLVTGGSVATFATSVGTGEVNLSLTDTQTASLGVGTYGWRLDWTAPGDVKRTALTGVVEVTA
jgi:hypothetical protein